MKRIFSLILLGYNMGPQERSFKSETGHSQKWNHEHPFQQSDTLRNGATRNGSTIVFDPIKSNPHTLNGDRVYVQNPNMG